jgi:hypothetical protein
MAATVTRIRFDRKAERRDRLQAAPFSGEMRDLVRPAVDWFTVG